jgi:hypothetical protein
MRASLPFVLAISVLAACGGSGDDDGGDDGGDDDGPSIDAGATDSFDIVTPGIVIAPGDERTHCFYTTVPVDRAVGVARWSSTMSLGSHHMIVYALSGSSDHAEGIEEDCNVIGGGSDIPAWTYSAQTPEAEFVMPEGVGIALGAEQKIVIEMHYLNATTDPITAHVELTGDVYAADEDFTPAAAFITYNTEIEIPSHGSGSAGGACAVPDGSKFFALSTHAHKRAVHTQVSDDGEVVFESDNWEHPGAEYWGGEPFYEFGDKLTYECDYENDLDVDVVDGPSAVTDEMCMAVGYFFPADGPLVCFNDTVIPL